MKPAEQWKCQKKKTILVIRRNLKHSTHKPAGGSVPKRLNLGLKPCFPSNAEGFAFFIVSESISNASSMNSVAGHTENATGLHVLRRVP